MTMEQDVELLFPQGKQVTVKKEVLTIMPYGFGQFPRVLKAIKDIADKVPDTKPTAEGVVSMGTKEITELVISAGEPVVQLCAIATKKDIKWFDDVPSDQAVDLLTAIVEVNRDFFVKRLQPKMMAAIENLSGLVGAVSSPDSSQPGTD